MAPNQKTRALQTAREQLRQQPADELPKLSWQELLKANTGVDIEQCPHCKAGKMTSHTELPRAPPDFTILPFFI